LIEEIKKSSQSIAVLNRRYAVRFIMLDNFNLYQYFIKEMTKLGIQIFNLEQQLDADNKDSWISTDMLVNAIKNLKWQIVVSSFSDQYRENTSAIGLATTRSLSLPPLWIYTNLQVCIFDALPSYVAYGNRINNLNEAFMRYRYFPY
jgi:hypothetical protein